MGVIIDRIIKGSPAKKYGLQSGDIIIKANDTKLE
jgi:S1-C subfamily serine protease